MLEWAFTVIQGLVINLGFATEEELKTWATMKVPDILSRLV